MKRTIFYSWQSDLPNNFNRGFIESCLTKAIRQVNDIVQFQLEFNIDRDTRSEIGTPNILDSIFRKIERSKVFIADISIINPDSEYRKCPNPNVLIELGYAARVLGWERVFCFYNTDYGKIEELPFDLRQRRPILYSLKGKNKSEVRNAISKILAESIVELHKNGGLFDKIDDYIKEKIDTELLTIAGHLGKMLFGYNGKSAPELLQLVMNLSDEEIETSLKSQEFIGFQLFKNLNVHERNLRAIADGLISSVHHNREMTRPIIELVSWVGRFDAFNSPRNEFQWFKKLDSKTHEYRVASPSQFAKNDKLPNRFVLLKNLNEKEGIVVDFGDFIYKPRVQNLMTRFKFDDKSIKIFVSIIRHFIKATEDWLDLTNGEIIIDFQHNFEIKQTKHNNES
ncbi:hypothetical protein [Sunxiuqinia sp. sy24]|uniref:hypothetical protein n=1 Tax=Sunxiuqinia sp. sy24 TaxID=3461495 RepID=UPI0040451D5F